MPNTKTNKALEAELLKLTSDRMKQIIFEVAASQGVTPKSLFKTIADGMNSEVEKVAFDAQLGKFFYSKKYIDHNVRLKAASLGAENLGMKTVQRMEISGRNGGPIPLTIIDLGGGIFLSPRPIFLPKLTGRIEELREKYDLSLEELIKGVAEQRKEYCRGDND